MQGKVTIFIFSQYLTLIIDQSNVFFQTLALIMFA